ncbi:MAG: tRNA (adenosine(37)-N6)-threonylcarbamoyltransferase complex dimerization subunit type 1 TsaB [Paludibacteraceae bacterium]|nr:tRNA (adenosine(37)-N6)-threonylcarbamoyltransferase complex dimerization subunit type 1 TsaB [Paludibacteraceae bacterium]MBP5482467.1 tRNA (adenosine(37)-N6)-threonylcarbamoyltransferase complex dimerization subunit type 1 TsaB [Paludibacteraceae bacterium]
MANIILIDTATEICSVALSIDGKVSWSKENFEGMTHSTLLAKFLQELTEHMRSSSIKADAVAVSCGPGSYTGLRIGVSTAKGLCFGANVPLLAINTLEVMAQGYISQHGKPGNDTWLCPMIDARRMEVYTALFDGELNLKREISADIIDENSYADILQEKKIICFGNGASKCKETLTHPNISFVDGIYPLASNMADLAEKCFAKKDFKDVAYFEPFYLKEFVATVSKNKFGI